MVGLLIAVTFILSAVLLWHIAAHRGANTFFWALMGALFGPLAIPFVFLAGKKTP
jgi:asparagine N-glycosylation enzyme membrane subunit Stt3